MSDEFVTIPFPTARPALPANVYIPLTLLFIIVYGLIFLSVYIQLLLILYYKHKRFSYQTAFLFLALFWSSLRIVLYSFYFNNAEDANRLFFIFYFCLYCLPVVLQFSMLCLLVLYYGQLKKVYFKIATRANRKKNNYILRSVIIISIAIFLASSVLTAYYTREICTFQKSKPADCHLFRITFIRVLIDGALFLIFGFLLCTFVFKLAKLSIYNTIPEQNNISILKATTVSLCCSFLLITRTVYNILAITIHNFNLPDFGFDWLNVSDQADLVNLTETDKFIAYGVIILIWELIPTLVVIILFRLRINLFQSCFNATTNNNNIQSSISVFLDNEASQTLINNDDDDDDEAFYNYYNRNDPVSYQSSRHLGADFY